MVDHRPPSYVDIHTRTREEHGADHNYLHRATTGTYLMPPPSGNAATDTENLEDALATTLAEAQTFGLYGGEILLGKGIYRFAPIEVRGAIRLRLRGIFGQTKWLYSGDATGCALTVVNSQWCRISDLVMDMGAGAASALRCLRDAGTGFAPSQNQFENIFIDGKNATPNAILIGGDGSINANNDYMQFKNIEARGYTNTGASLNGSQSYGNNFEDCSFQGGTGAQYGVNAVLAGFFWKRGRIFAHAGADYRIKGWYQPIIIDGHLGEDNARLLILAQSHRTNVLMRDARWAGNNAHPDGRIIVAEGGVRASLMMQGCNLGDGGNPKALTMDFTGAHANSRLWYEGSDFFTTAEQPVVGITPTRRQGIALYDNEATTHYKMWVPEI